MKRFLKRLYTWTYFVSLVPLKLYDILHGTEFSGIEIQDESDGRFSYFPSSVFSFPMLAGYIRRRMRGGKGHAVLDIGCGKGFVLLFFCRRHFDRVSGIEYDKKLCLQARTNLKKLSQKVGSLRDF